MIQKHANISIFVPHLGCPNMCSFCNQVHITGKNKAPTGEDVIRAVKTAEKSLKEDCKNAEIAFFGGSFTAIEPQIMLELLDAAYPFVRDGRVYGIRISTRPDAINTEILDLLKKKGVKAIELGAQSMCDDVLLKNRRGHTADDVIKASALIKEYGFELGLQMMTGLLGDNDEKSKYTARKIAEIAPETVRIYPCIVLKNTELERLVKNGTYKPQTVEEAVELCAWLLEFFREKNINVIRTGLHTIDGQSFVDGPWHPAFGELCESRIYLKKVLENLKEKGKYEIFVSPKAVSKMVGQNRSNIELLKINGYECKVKTDRGIDEFCVRVREM